jgi:hypothetical protein
MTRSYSDRFPDIPETGSSLGNASLSRTVLRSIRTPTQAERATARRYLEAVAPDLLDVLGLA